VVSTFELLSHRLDGELIDRRSPRFEEAWLPARAHEGATEPTAVVRCASVGDVVRTLQCAGETHVVPRAGGHCFAGRSSTTGIVLDVGPLDGVEVDGAGRVEIGAGARLGRIYDALHAVGRALPCGCGPTVGIAGLTLGGGLGLLGRRHGLTCDHLVGAEVVLADGRVVRCDAERDPGLFWGLRGAGGGQLGVVTSLVFDTIPEPVLTRFELEWTSYAAEAVLHRWQAWAPDAPPEITADLTLVAEPGRPDRVLVFGAAVADSVRTLDLLAPLTDLLPEPLARDVEDGLPYRDLKAAFAGLDRAEQTTVWKSRSEYVDRLPAAVVTDLVAVLRSDRRPGAGRALNLTALGGAYDAVPPAATAYAHRGRRFLLEHVAHADPGWVDRSWETAHVAGTGQVYPNFPDPALTDPMRAYHGANLERLRAVKRRYDPQRRFRFPQSL
jgi:FAD/FMN-containing dehydrogenase